MPPGFTAAGTSLRNGMNGMPRSAAAARQNSSSRSASAPRIMWFTCTAVTGYPPASSRSSRHIESGPPERPSRIPSRAVSAPGNESGGL